MTERMDADDRPKPGSLEMKREETVEPVSIYCATTLRITLCARSESEVMAECAALASFKFIQLMYERQQRRSTPATHLAQAILRKGRF